MKKKTLVYGRHSKKDGQVIGQEGIDFVKDHPVPCNFITDLFHGVFVRTAQSLIASMTALGSLVEHANLHPIVEEIGSQEKFNEIVSDQFKALVKDGRSNLEALRGSLSADKFQKFLEWAANGVQKMFNQMEEKGNGLAYGHSPVIEAAAEYFGLKVKNHQLAPCEYLIFTQDEDGKILVQKPE